MNAPSRNSPVIRLDPADNVVVARLDIAAGTPVPDEDVDAGGDIQQGHKMAAKRIDPGDLVTSA